MNPQLRRKLGFHVPEDRRFGDALESFLLTAVVLLSAALGLAVAGVALG